MVSANPKSRHPKMAGGRIIFSHSALYWKVPIVKAMVFPVVVYRYKSIFAHISLRDNSQNRKSSNSVTHSQIHAWMLLFIYACKDSSIPRLICIVGSQDIFECISTQIHLFIHVQHHLFMHPCNFDTLLHLWALKSIH